MSNKEKIAQHQWLELKLKMRAFAYNCAMVILLLIAIVGIILSFAAWMEPDIWRGLVMSWTGLVIAWRRLAIAAVATIGAGGVLVLVVWVFRARDRWMHDVARYESFDLFLVCVKEQRGPSIMGMGRWMVSRIGEPIGELIVAAYEQSKEENIRKKFYDLKEDWSSGRLSREQYHAAIDRLFEAVSKSAT